MLGLVLGGFLLGLRHPVTIHGLQLIRSHFRPRVCCGGCLRRHKSPIQQPQQLVEPLRSSALWWRHTSLCVISCHCLASTDERKVINHAQCGPSRPCPVVSVPIGALRWAARVNNYFVAVDNDRKPVHASRRGSDLFSPTRLYWEP